LWDLRARKSLLREVHFYTVDREGKDRVQSSNYFEDRTQDCAIARSNRLATQRVFRLEITGAERKGRSEIMLNVVVESEFVRMRTQTDGVRLILALVADVRFEQLLAEHIPFEQEPMIVFESCQRLFKR